MHKITALESAQWLDAFSRLNEAHDVLYAARISGASIPSGAANIMQQNLKNCLHEYQLVIPASDIN